MKSSMPVMPASRSAAVAETAAALGIEGGKQNMGKLMGPVMAKVKGLADGNAVKKVVQEFLG